MTEARKQVLRWVLSQEYVFSLDMAQRELDFDKVTVYRILQVCEELGIVQKLQTMEAYVVLPEVVVGGCWRIYIDVEHTKVFVQLLDQDVLGMLM